MNDVTSQGNRDPLDHDGDGKKGGSKPKTIKAPKVEATAAEPDAATAPAPVVSAEEAAGAPRETPRVVVSDAPLSFDQVAALGKSGETPPAPKPAVQEAAPAPKPASAVPGVMSRSARRLQEEMAAGQRALNKGR